MSERGGNADPPRRTPEDRNTVRSGLHWAHDAEPIIETQLITYERTWPQKDEVQWGELRSEVGPSAAKKVTSDQGTLGAQNVGR